MLIGRYHHPIWTLIASTVLVAAGLGLLWAGLPIMACALALYGAGIGIESSSLRPPPPSSTRC